MSDVWVLDPAQKTWTCARCQVVYDATFCPGNPDTWITGTRVSRHKYDCVPFSKPVDIWGAVQEDMQARDKMGKAKYGVDLLPFNGRDMLKEAYEEALDMVVYLRTLIWERDGK